MDYLKAAIGLRAYGHRDPLVEYREEAHRAFATLIDAIYEDLLRFLFRANLLIQQPAPQEESPLDGKVSYSNPEEALTNSSTSARRIQNASSQAQGVPTAQTPQPKEEARPQTYKKDEDDPYANIGRNDPCPCGSGKKFKKCHGANR